jgi:hypothetical protein
VKRSQLLAEIDAAKVVTCSVPGCGRPVYCKGWCSAHYRRVMTTGDVRPTVPLRIAKYGPEARCSVKGCNRRPYAKGKCQKHWAQDKRRG